MLLHRWNTLIKSQFHSITGEQLSPRTKYRFWTQYGTGGSAVGSELLWSRVWQSCKHAGRRPNGAVGTPFFKYNPVSCDYIACGGGILLIKLMEKRAVVSLSNRIAPPLVLCLLEYLC